jgi:hypothetical protein
MTVMFSDLDPMFQSEHHQPHGGARRRESAMIDNLQWVDDVLSGGCHALIKGTNERYWITPHRAGFHEWTREIFVGAALHRAGFLAWAETLDGAKTIAEHHYAATAQGKAAQKLSGATGDGQPS